MGGRTHRKELSNSLNNRENQNFKHYLKNKIEGCFFNDISECISAMQ